MWRAIWTHTELNNGMLFVMTWASELYLSVQDVIFCFVVGYQRFGGPCCFHLHCEVFFLSHLFLISSLFIPVYPTGSVEEEYIMRVAVVAVPWLPHGLSLMWNVPWVPVGGECSDEANHSLATVIRLRAPTHPPPPPVKWFAGYEGVEALFAKSENWVAPRFWVATMLPAVSRALLFPIIQVHSLPSRNM
jgi:hypothetical protein